MAQASPIVDCVLTDLPCRVGGRKIWARLARGGMADVLLAAGDPGPVVIKRVRADRASEAGLAEQLVAEARLTECLRHPNVIRALEHGEDDSGPFLVLEYIDGLDLHAVLASCSRQRLSFPLALRLAVVCSVLRALDYAHRARDERQAPFEVVHRDISPANVLIGFDGAVKLCDFGIASATVMPDLDDRIDGKASYMSPEHARGEGVDPRSDLYSCGILLWEMVAGRRMRAQGPDRLASAQRGEVPPLAVVGIGDDASLLAVVTRALAFDPDERYESAGAMMRDLERWCRHNDVLAGDSEMGRFMREHFADRRLALEPIFEDAAEHLADLKAGDLTPTHSGTRPRSALAQTANAPKASWLSATPVFVVSAAVTLAILTVLALAGIL